MIIPKIRQTLLDIERINLSKGGTKMVARMEIARSLGVSLATVENIIKQRVKSVRVELALSINRLLLTTIEAQRAQLERKRQQALELDLAINPAQMASDDALLERARATLRALAKKDKRP